jgi:hypothetical protein
MPKTGLDALLRFEDSILVLIDHQPYQFHQTTEYSSERR